MKLVQPYVDPPIAPIINVTDDVVIIQSGNDRLIIPRKVWTAKESLKTPKLVDKYISKTFAVLADDPSITEFGIASRIDDPHPMGMIPRTVFDVMAWEPEDESSDSRFKDHEARLVVVRAIFERSSRRWQFVWNGIKISAPITDPSFFDKLASREYVFGQGDILRVLLRVHQTRDDVANTFINAAYEVVSVRGVERAARQQQLPD